MAQVFVISIFPPVYFYIFFYCLQDIKWFNNSIKSCHVNVLTVVNFEDRTSKSLILVYLQSFAVVPVTLEIFL